MGLAGPNDWARHKPRKQWADIGPKRLGRLGPLYFLSLLFGGAGPDPAKHLGWAINLPGPSEGWINCRTWTVSSRSACNFAVADGRVMWEATLRGGGKQLLSPAWSEVGGGLCSRPEAGGGVCGGLGAAAADTGEGRKRKWWGWWAAAAVEKKRRSFRWRGISVVERVEDELVAAWLGVAESTVERECRERDLLQKNWGGWFFRIFGPDFFLLPEREICSYL